ncbi:MAG: folate family ECF transporter S component [Clostridia bacterium]|nr:folate family ECF transporter S component [Clostridia bacterium]
MSTKTVKRPLTCSVFSREYWSTAASEMKSTRSLVFAALIVALRVTVKLFKIPLAAGLELSFDCYVNALGSIVYGPLMGLMVGAVSDTVGCAVEGFAGYFLPFILVEMSSSFIFGLFLWRRELTVTRTISAKFSVNLFCNIILTSIFVKWSMYFFTGADAAEAYNIINLVRVVKNLVLFPLEGVLIIMVLSAFLPALKSLNIIPKEQDKLVLTKKHIIFVIVCALLSVALVLFYFFYLKDFVKAHNIKLF